LNPSEGSSKAPETGAFSFSLLPRGQLRDAAKELAPGEAALMVVGEPTLAKGFDKAVTRADKVAKETFDAEADQLADELIKAAKS
jgi:hypothetical protein